MCLKQPSRWRKFARWVNEYAPSWLLVILTFGGVYYYYVQSELLGLQTKSLEMQTIAIMNSPNNRPRIKCSSVALSDRIQVTVNNEGADYEGMELEATKWLHIFYDGIAHELPVAGKASLRDLKFEHPFSSASGEVPQDLDLKSVLRPWDDSQKIRLLPFAVVRVLYKDMFHRGPFQRYFKLFGVALASKAEETGERKASRRDALPQKKVRAIQPTGGNSRTHSRYDWCSLGYGSGDWGGYDSYDGWDTNYYSGWDDRLPAITLAEGQRYFATCEKGPIKDESGIRSFIADLIAKGKE